MKHLFIVNPTAGGSDRTANIRKAAEELFSGTGEEYEIYVTTGPKDATREVKERGESGEEYRVYSCGGDGTFNECVNGGAGYANIAMAPYPAGTGNDFCRMFGEESELFKDMKALTRGSVHAIDAIDCNGVYSVNICSVGIDARIGCNVHKYTDLPLVGGSTGYVISAIVEMLKGISMPVKIRTEGYESSGKKTLACVCNGRYYGGGFNPCSYAMPDDGVLDIYIAKKLNLFQFAGMIGSYSKGKADEKLTKYIDILHGTEIFFEFDEEQIVNIDGEALYAKEVTMKLVPKCINLIVPEGMRFFEKAE